MSADTSSGERPRPTKKHEQTASISGNAGVPSGKRVKSVKKKTRRSSEAATRAAQPSRPAADLGKHRDVRLPVYATITATITEPGTTQSIGPKDLITEETLRLTLKRWTEFLGTFQLRLTGEYPSDPFERSWLHEHLERLSRRVFPSNTGPCDSASLNFLKELHAGSASAEGKVEEDVYRPDDIALRVKARYDACFPAGRQNDAGDPPDARTASDLCLYERVEAAKFYLSSWPSSDSVKLRVGDLSANDEHRLKVTADTLLEYSTGLSLHENHDPIARYLVAHRWGVEDDGLRDLALGQIADHLPLYQQALAVDPCWIELVNDAYDKAAPAWYRQQILASAQEDWPHVLNELVDLRGRPRGCVKSGIPSLDKSLFGCNGITVIGADRGAGKTTFVCQMVINSLASRSDVACLFLSLDMSQATILHRFICGTHQLTYRELMERENNEGLECPEWFSRLKVMGGTDWLSQTPDVADEIVVAANVLANREVTNLIVAIDLHQQLPATGGDANSADQERAQILKRVEESLAQQGAIRDVSIIAISEIRKSDGTKTGLTSNDLLGSGRLASVASNILLLEPDPTADVTTAERSAMTLRIAKGRDGVQRGDHPLWFYYDQYRFEAREGTENATPPTAKTKPGKVDAVTTGVTRKRRNQAR